MIDYGYIFLDKNNWCLNKICKVEVCLKGEYVLLNE